MATRRLPRSNAERNAAFSRAKERKDATTDPLHIPFTPATIDKLDIGEPAYKVKLAAVAAALSLQTEATATVNAARTLAGYFASDMLEAMQRAVRRGTFPASARAYYQLPVGEALSPRIRTDAEVLEWGEKTLQGENDRVAAGGAPITFPDQMEVQNAYTAFKNADLNQSVLKSQYDDAQQDLQAVNPEVDKLILKLWNEIETFFDEGDKPAMRRKAREWGVVYLPSKGETPTPDEYSLIGQAKLENGTPEADVTITIKELGLDIVTEPDGRYYFGILPAGSYTVVAQKDGFEDVVVPAVVITNGQLTELNFTMNPIAITPIEP